MVAKELATERAEEILDRLMEIIAVDGFASLKVAEMARRLRCSTGTLYRVAPSKESLVIAAIQRWSELSLQRMKAEAEQGASAVDIARRYHAANVRGSRTLSRAFRDDVNAHESMRRLYTSIYERVLEQFTEYLDRAVRAGEIRQVNPRFLAALFRQMGLIASNPIALETAGIGPEEASDQVDLVMWEGLLPRD